LTKILSFIVKINAKKKTSCIHNALPQNSLTNSTKMSGSQNYFRTALFFLHLRYFTGFWHLSYRTWKSKLLSDRDT